MESLIQLNNYRPHPTDSKYMIFIYHDYKMACTFEDGLVESDLFFEKDVTENGPNKRWLYAVKKRDFQAVKKWNNIAIGTHRKPFISDPILRYVVIAISVGVMALAFIGFLKS
ncbi:MAG: hypothetical protein HKO93_01535 [Flavobacteriales bacterium]|nr:hypothetical protein [Flavobacteriales bacterium]